MSTLGEGREIERSLTLRAGLFDRGFHLFQASAGDEEGIAFPVFVVEELEGEDRPAAVLAQGFQHVGNRGDAVAGEDTKGVVDFLRPGFAGVVVHVDELQGIAAEQAQAVEIRTAFVQVEDVGEHAGLGMAGFQGNEDAVAEAAKIGGKAPDFQFWNDAHLVAEFQERAIALGGLAEVEAGSFRRSSGRSGEALSADLGDDAHVALGLFQSFGALGFVVDDPLGKADGAFDGEAKVGDALAQVFQGAAAFFVLMDFFHPGFNGLVAGLGSEFHLGDDIQFVAADGRGIEAVDEGTAGHGRGSRVFGAANSGFAGEDGGGGEARTDEGGSAGEWFGGVGHGKADFDGAAFRLEKVDGRPGRMPGRRGIRNEIAEHENAFDCSRGQQMSGACPRRTAKGRRSFAGATSNRDRQFSLYH